MPINKKDFRTFSNARIHCENCYNYARVDLIKKSLCEQDLVHLLLIGLAKEYPTATKCLESCMKCVEFKRPEVSDIIKKEYGTSRMLVLIKD